MFDCTGAIFLNLYGASLTLGPFLPRRLKNKFEKSSRAWMESIYDADLNISKSGMRDMTRIIVVDQEFMSNLSFEISHLTGKTT